MSYEPSAMNCLIEVLLCQPPPLWRTRQKQLQLSQQIFSCLWSCWPLTTDHCFYVVCVFLIISLTSSIFLSFAAVLPGSLSFANARHGLQRYWVPELVRVSVTGTSSAPHFAHFPVVVSVGSSVFCSGAIYQGPTGCPNLLGNLGCPTGCPTGCPNLLGNLGCPNLFGFRPIRLIRPISLIILFIIAKRERLPAPFRLWLNPKFLRFVNYLHTRP